ncbi:protein Skeletor, isoforms B/C-like [Rhipicephalus microplus]|uniref:protein Skeletor, isoforms B/C-like n=1 Tax=Rhipicephalus microplus TaxID=6941 RepID=UPI003F6B3D77
MVRHLVSALLLAFIDMQGVMAVYYGPSIGAITTFKHGVSGNVFAATEMSIIISDLTYDGTGPGGRFMADKTDKLTDSGDLIPDEHGKTEKLKKYTGETVHLTLTKKVTEYKSFGIYCTVAKVDFGHVVLPPNFMLPKEQSLGKLSPMLGKTSADDVTLKDSATMLLKQFQYDAGCAGSAFFMAAPNKYAEVAQMTKLLYNGNTDKLPRIAKTDVTLSLPAGKNWNDFTWFSVYCVDTKASHADLDIDSRKALAVPVHQSAIPPPGPGPVPGPAPSPQNPDDKKTGDKGDAGSLSVLSLLTLTIAAVMTALVTRQCFEGGQHVKSS